MERNGKHQQPRSGRGKDERRLEFRRDHDRRNAAVGALGEWLINRQLQPLILVDAEMATIFLNQAARDVLRHTRWLRLSHRRLRVVDPGLRKDLESAVAAWPGAARSSMQFSRGSHALEVTAVSVSPPLSGVYAITMESEKAVSHRLLMKSFGLTHAEADVVALVHGGKNRVSVAQHLGKPLDTVKSRLQRAYKKLTVKSQRELVKKVSEWAARAYVKRSHD